MLTVFLKLNEDCKIRFYHLNYLPNHGITLLVQVPVYVRQFTFSKSV